jgi:hypothetical protein
MVRLGAHSLVAEARRGTRVVWTGEAAWQEPSDLARVLSELIAAPEAGRSFRNLSVVVERPLVQIRRLTDVPPVPLRVLKTLIQTQAARYFRRNGVPLVTDASWLGRNGDRAAQLCAMEVSLLEAVADGAQAAGLRLVSVVPADRPRLSLLPPSTRAAQLARLRRSVLRWTVAAVVGWGLVATSYLVKLTIDRRRVERELARLEQPAAALLALRREMRTARGMVAAVDATEQVEHDLGRQLGDIAAAVPDSAFLSLLTLSAAGDGAVTGYARRASEVAASFERSNRIRAPRFEGRLTKELLLGREWDRFTIAFGDTAKAGRRRGG